MTESVYYTIFWSIHVNMCMSVYTYLNMSNVNAQYKNDRKEEYFMSFGILYKLKLLLLVFES